MILNETSLEVIEMFIDYGACVQIRDNKGCTPLHLAVKSGRYDVLEMMLNKFQGEDEELFKLKDLKGHTCFHAAVLLRSTTEDQLQLMLTRGASATDYDYEGYSALHLAAHADNSHLLKILCEYSTDKYDEAHQNADYKTEGGNLALHIALENKNIKSAIKLIELGANGYALNQNSRSAVDIAKNQGLYQVIEYLPKTVGTVRAELVGEQLDFNITLAKKSIDDKYGFEYEFDADKLMVRVTRVVPKSLASRNDLRRNDLIIEINQRDATLMQNDDVDHMLLLTTSVNLKIRRILK